MLAGAYGDVIRQSPRTGCKCARWACRSANCPEQKRLANQLSAAKGIAANKKDECRGHGGDG